MIDQIKGTVIESGPQSIVVAINDGISLALAVPQESAFAIPQVHVYTYLHWHQENGPTLYGFQSKRDRQVFQLIISCSGIGPKMGLAILQAMSAASFMSAIITDNIAALSSVAGIGKKKAETLILHLKDKISKLIDTGVLLLEESSNIQHVQDVMNTLLSLNYTKQETAHALDMIKKKEDIGQLQFDVLLRKSLLVLSKRS